MHLLQGATGIDDDVGSIDKLPVVCRIEYLDLPQSGLSIPLTARHLVTQVDILIDAVCLGSALEVMEEFLGTDIRVGPVWVSFP